MIQSESSSDESGAGVVEEAPVGASPGRNGFRPAVVMPSYNTGGALLARTVADALRSGLPVFVVIDGSNDGSAFALEALAQSHPAQLRVIRHWKNAGKGAAIETGLRAARAEGISHILTMDADGQHPGKSIPALIKAASEDPLALVMGAPQFGPDAPKVRLYGRKLTIFWTTLETLGGGLGDTLFGMRVYPVEALTAAFRETRWGRRFDFDPELAVRLVWRGSRPVQVPVPCRYLGADEGGVSHFHYGRDNLRLTWLHLRLLPEFIFYRLWVLLFRRLQEVRG